MATDTLSFSVQLATSREDIREACLVRAASYGHHLPELGERFAQAEALDHAEGTAIVLCRDKQTGRGVGTARFQLSAFGPLMLENSLILPEHLSSAPRAEITRLAVVAGADPLIKLCLMKASYLYCMAAQQRWMVIGARNEALIRNYRRLGFKDVFGPDDRFPLAHAGGLPHRILSFDVAGAERSWRASGHPLYAFMVDTYHADLQLFQPVKALRPELDLGEASVATTQASESARRSLRARFEPQAQRAGQLLAGVGLR